MRGKYSLMMKKFVLITAMLLTLSCGRAVWSQVETDSSLSGAAVEAPEGKKILEVEISGLKNVPIKTVWSAIKTRKGQKYKQTVIDDDIRKMFDLNLFSSINVDLSAKDEGVKIIFLAVEKPLIKQIDFKGNKAIKNSALKEEVTLKEKEAMDEAKLAESKNKLITKYKEKGFAEIKVETSLADAGNGQEILTFVINEGQKIRIDQVIVSGNSYFPTKKILKVVKTRKKKVYKEETLSKDVEKLNKFYRERGFYNFKMSEPEVVFNEARDKITIKMSLREGLRYKIGSIKFTNNKVVSLAEITKDFPVKVNKYYSQEDFDLAVATIQFLYADKGYVFARVDPKVTLHDDIQTMDIDYEVTEGPLAYAGEIQFGGNEITKDYVIEREILLKKGDPLRMSKVRRSEERLFNLGFFEDVALETRPNQENPEDHLDLIFNVKEKSQLNVLSLGLGYSSVDKVVGNMQVQINNLFGRGQRTNILYEVGSRRQNYEISFFDPWFLQHYFSFGANVFDTRREKNYYWNKNVDKYIDPLTGNFVSQPTVSETKENDLYNETHRGGGITFGKRFKEIYNGSIGYTYESVLVKNITDRYYDEIVPGGATIRHQKISDEIANQIDRGTVATSSLSLGFSRDTRDNVFDTTKGSSQRVSYTVAGGYLSGDNYFQKVVLDTSWFLPSFWKFVWGFHAMLGVVNNFGQSTAVPVYERFYMGGAETVRGYEYRGEIGVIEGGKLTSLFNLEYSFPIVREKRQTIIKGALFYDAGNTWSTTRLGHYDYALKQGIGFGLRFTIPMFPIRLDWAYGLNHREGEQKSQLHFSIGTVF